MVYGWHFVVLAVQTSVPVQVRFSGFGLVVRVSRLVFYGWYLVVLAVQTSAPVQVHDFVWLQDFGNGRHHVGGVQ